MLFSSRHIFAVVVALVGAAEARRQIPRYLAISKSPATYAIQLATGTGVAVNDGTATSSASAGSTGLPPFANTTTAAAGTGLTTLTISATSVETLISCAPTVTNCPTLSGTGALPTSLPEGVSTVLVTTVIDVTTTVCPITEVPAVSSSVLASFSSPPPTETGAAVTDVAAGSGAEATSAPAVSVTETITSVVTTTMISISTVEVPGTCVCPAATAAAAYNATEKYKLRRSPLY
ncbi:hypothetical protein F5B18DRAFT_361349 [Nemania serpens]|nr:hypothetical protein F5B18DRAFT_361349 [Nemania serpens]